MNVVAVPVPTPSPVPVPNPTPVSQQAIKPQQILKKLNETIKEQQKEEKNPLEGLFGVGKSSIKSLHGGIVGNQIIL